MVCPNQIPMAKGSNHQKGPKKGGNCEVIVHLERYKYVYIFFSQ
jgi:hypothetical protein